MKKRAREDLNKTFTGLAGWLFADLLLALAILFLIANTLPQPKPPEVGPTPTATATPVVVPPSLEQQWHRFNLNIDPQKLLSNDAGEKNAVIQHVMEQGFLKNRRAGLMVVYGGAPTVNDTKRATEIASAIYDILTDLGKQDSRFKGISRYLPLYSLGDEPTLVNIDIFLFIQ